MQKSNLIQRLGLLRLSIIQINTCFSVVLFFSNTIAAQSDSWWVQLGVFEEKVDINYFNELGSAVYHSKDTYGFHRYYKKYNNESDAQAGLAKAQAMNYYPLLIPADKLSGSCCLYIPPPKSFLNSIKNIFFDFDKSTITAKASRELDDLIAILREFPNYTTSLRAHTDAKGSNSYNDALSLRRAESAKRYLVTRGISATRIKTSTYGEGTPIAKNTLASGQDTETGRQFNRRVEILILSQDGHVLNDMVEDIDVPIELKY